jgi:hypothetical protein
VARTGSCKRWEELQVKSVEGVPMESERSSTALVGDGSGMSVNRRVRVGVVVLTCVVGLI